MAVNKYMKPAEQPLLDTYVPLPFKELSLAYATKQKEHNDAEELAGSLDDKILKVRASTPLHTRELLRIRTELDTELNDLITKHNGRYADMVPSLNKIKKRIDQDFTDGNLFAIKETTKRKGKLDKEIEKQESKGTYSDEYSPWLGGEAEFSHFYNQGLVSDGSGGYTWDTDASAGFETRPDGSQVLKTYEYTGLHKGSEQLKIANENTFDKIKPDLNSWMEKTEKGEMTKNELKQISLSKIYRAAHNDHPYYPDDFQQELDLIVHNWMKPEAVLSSAMNAIDNIFGVNPTDADVKEAKQDAIDGLNADQIGEDGYNGTAYNWAKTAYVGSMGEKYLMTDQAYSHTFDDNYGNKNKNAVPRTDWVPIVESTTPFVQAGKPRDIHGDYINESSNPIAEYLKIVDTNKKTLMQINQEYQDIVNSGANLDDDYIDEWQEKINTAEYQYDASAFAAVNLIQDAATNLGLRKRGNYLIYHQNGTRKQVLIGSTDYNLNGWAAVQFDDNGVPYDVEDSDYRNLRRPGSAYNYLDVSHGLLAGVYHIEANSGNSPLFDEADRIQASMGTDGYFGGRSIKLPMFSTTSSKQMDESILTNLVTTLSKEDQYFRTSSGTEVTLKDLITGVDIGGDTKKIDQDIIDDFDKYVKTTQWTAVPDPATGSYLGVITIPLKNPSGTNATMNLYYPAPKEVMETWRRQGEYEEVLDEDLGTTHKITRPRTAVEKAKWDDIFHAQLDIQRAISVPGNVQMSSYEDGEGNPLGFFYFSELPNGQPILNEQYMFQPQAGLIAGINPQDGSTIYTTGNELYNVDTDVDKLGYLISLNDPNMEASRAFWMNQAQAPETPIAVEGSTLQEPATGVGSDVSGKPFVTQLRKGQYMFPDDRLEGTDDILNYGGITKDVVGLQKQTAVIFAEAGNKYNVDMIDFMEKELDKIEADGETHVELADGSKITLAHAINQGYVTLQPVSGGTSRYMDQGFRVPLASGARTYEKQLKMYNEWVDGGKNGPPVANPAEGGFHVMGQAADLDQNEAMYDWVFTTTGDVVGIGGLNAGVNTVYQGLDATQKTVTGILASELQKDDGTKIFPNFKNASLKTLFTSLDKAHSSSPRPLLGPGLKQFDQEWWHWSQGEITGTPAATYTYPSWAN